MAVGSDHAVDQLQASVQTVNGVVGAFYFIKPIKPLPFFRASFDYWDKHVLNCSGVNIRNANRDCQIA